MAFQIYLLFYVYGCFTFTNGLVSKKKLRRGLRSPRIGVTDNSELPCRYWESNLGTFSSTCGNRLISHLLCVTDLTHTQNQKTTCTNQFSPPYGFLESNSGQPPRWPKFTLYSFFIPQGLLNTEYYYYPSSQMPWVSDSSVTYWLNLLPDLQSYFITLCISENILWVSACVSLKWQYLLRK